MPTIQDSKNLLVNWLNKNQSGNVQTNINKSGPTNTKDVSVNNILPNQNLKTWTQNKLQQKGIIQPTIQTNNNSKIQAQMDKWKQLNNQQNVNFVANQNNQSRFIGLQNNNNLPSTDLGGNIIQENVDKKKKEEFDRRANKPVLNIPTKKSQIEQFNKNQSETYRTNENVIKDFHYDVQKFGGQMTKEQISQLYPEFAGKEDIALMLQSDLLPLVQNNEFADMKKLSELYPELLPKQKKAGDQILKDQEKEGQQIKDLAKKAEKTLSRYNVLSKNGEKYMQDVWQVGNFVDTIRKDYKLPGNPSDLDIINFGKENIPELKAILDDMEMLKSNYNLTERDRDIIFENGFDLGEWLYQAGADIQNFTQNNQLGDYLDRNSSTWERQLSNLGINGSSANTIANLPKKALDTAEIPVNMVGELASGLGQVGMATERIATQQNRNEDGTVDTNGVIKDIVMGGGGAMTVGWNTVMAIPTAIYNLANETEAGAVLTDTTIGNADRGLDKLLSGKTLKGIGLDDNAIAEWYNNQDEQTQAEARKILLTAIFHKGSKGVGKLKKLGNFEINSVEKALGDLAKQKITIETNSPSFKAKVEQGLADGLMKVSDDGMLTDAQGNNIGKVKVRKMKTGEKVKYVVDKVISDNRAARNAKSLGELNPNALPDNRTFRDKAESQINQAKETAYEGAYQAGKMTRDVVDTVKEGVQNINVGNAVKGTAEAVGKGVKATSDLYNKGKNAVTQGKNAVTNAVKENVVEPFKKGYEGVKETVNENIVEPYNKGRGANEVNKGTVKQEGQPQESNSTLKSDTKVNGDNYTEKKTNSKTLNNTQLQIQQNENRMNPKDIREFKNRYKKDYGQVMYEGGFTKTRDENIDEMGEYINSLIKEKSDSISSIEGLYKDKRLDKMIKYMIKYARRTEDDAMFDKYNKLSNKHSKGGISTKAADDMRKEFSYKIKTGFWNDKNSEKIALATNLYSGVKDVLDEIAEANGFTDMRKINDEIAMRQHIRKGMIDKADGQSANNVYGINDYILMAEAFSNPENATIFVGKQLLKNKKIRNKVLNATVGGRKNAKNRITSESRQGVKENIKSIAEGKKLQESMKGGKQPALPEYIKFSKITEIDKRKTTSEDTTPPTENTPTEKVEETAPKKESESKPKNKVTSKKSAVTEKKTEVKEEKKAENKEVEEEVKKSENKKQGDETRQEQAENSNDRLRNVIDEMKNKSELSEDDLKKLAKAGNELGEDIYKLEKRGLEVPQGMLNSLKESIELLKEKGVDIFDWGKEKVYEDTDKFLKDYLGFKTENVDSKGIREYKAANDDLYPDDMVIIVDKVYTPSKSMHNSSGGISQIGQGFVVTRSLTRGEYEQSTGKNKVTGGKTAITENKEVKEQPKEEKQLETRVENKQPEPKKDIKEKIKEATGDTYKDEYGELSKGKKLYRGETYGNNSQIFWTDDKDIAESFGDTTISENDIIMDNPLDVRLPAVKKLLQEEIPGINIDSATSAYKPNIEEKKKLMNWAKENGYDGIIGETSDLGQNYVGNEYIVLKDNQVKPTKNVVTEKAAVTTKSEPKKQIKETQNTGESDITRNANIINNIKSFDDLKDLLKPTKAGAVSDWEYEGKLNGVKTRVWNYGDTIFIKYGDGQGPAQAMIDIKDADHIDQLKELLSEINNDGEILESNRNNPFSTKTEVTGEKNAVTSKATETEKPKNLVTNRPVDNSSITGRFRNLTLQDYKAMQKYEGLEDIYLNENVDTLKRALAIQDTLDTLKTSEEANNGSYEWNNSNFDIQEHKIDLHDKEVRKAIDEFIELYELSERVESGKATKEDQNKYDYFIDDYDQKTGKPDWNDEYIIEESQDRIQNIFKGDVYNPFISDFYNEFGRQIKKDTHKNLSNDIRELKNLVDKYGRYWEQGKSVDKKENTNIIGKNNSLTTKNPINERNNKASSGKENEGQSKLSNTVKNVQSNEGAGERPTDKGHGTSGKTVLNTSSNVTSEHRAGLTNGGTPNGVQPHKSIRTKGDNVITEKTVTQARDINRDCVDILEKHEFSDNPKDYTAEEIETLRQYEGRGGINDKSDTSTQGALNQYYTKDNIIKAMWRLLEGYNNTDILEPSMGVGRFFMYAPEGSNLAGFEYDKIPGTIAKILYPNADIKIGDFQDNFMLGKFSMGDNYTGKKYDIVIGNPPYEERQGRQKALGEEPKISRFDDYFIKRGVDMLKPGGHLAFVTSSQFLRGADNYAKQMISKNAELIDAYRIPVGAFDRTGVETDIIVLRKKEGGGDASWLSASKWFDEHPDKVLGEERDDIQGRFGPKKAVVGDLAAIDEIGKARVGTDGNPATIKSDFTPMKEVKQETPTTQKTIEAKQEKKVKPKKEFKPNEWKDWTETKENSDGTTETITWGKSLNGIVFKGKGGVTGRMVVGKGGIDKYQNLLNANGKIGDPDIKLEDDREGLNYIAGELEPNLLYASGQIPLKLEQLEKDYEGGFIDEKQYNKQKDLLEQAIPQEIEFQNIYFSPYTDWILNFPTNEIKSGWVNGERADVKATVRDLFTRRVGEKEDSYGNITYEKKTKNGVDTMTAKAADVMLDIIDNKGKKYPQEAKEKVITILPKEYNKFLKGETLDASTKTELQKAYNTKYNSYANFDYSDLGYTVDDISPTFRGDTFNISDVQARGISRILTTESIIIAHGVGQGKTIEGIIGAIASMQQGKARKALIVVPAGTKADRMQTTAQLFPNQEMVDLGSLAKGTGIRKRLVEMYGADPRDWIQDGQLVFLEHSAIGRQISFKNDTLTELEQSLTDAMESHFEEEKNIEDSKKQLERASKDLARAKENGASAADIEKKQKKMDEILGDIQRMGRTTENSLQDIMNTYRDKGLPDEGIGKALEFIDNDYDEFLHNMNEYLDNEINVGGAKIDKAQALEVAKDIFNNERAIYLEDLGIDHLTVDEAHNFRNLFNKAIEDDEEGGSYHAGMQVKEGSKQAKNLYAMSQYIMNKNGGGNVILLTATPFINNPSEMYNMLSYVGKNGMYEMGVQSMDDFYDTFVGLENRLTPTSSTSGVTYKNVMVGFHNVETLVKNLLDRYIDYEGESGKVVKPRLVTNVVRLKMSDTQMKVQKKLEEQIDKNEFDDEWEGNVVKTRKLNDKGEAKGAVLEGMTQANLNLISPYLTKYLKDKLSSITTQELIESSPKLKYHIEAIKLERKMGIMRGTFLYMEQGKELHEKLKKAIEEAIPGIRVGIINGDKKYSDLSSKEAEKLGIDPEGAKARQTAKKFSNGEIDVLIGGANTKEGLNLQGNGYHLIEISQPRNLNDRTQLIGRMQRQGNFSNEVLDTLLLMENSSDIYRFELMSRKGLRWNILEQLAAYKRGESIEDVVVDGQLDMDEEKLALFTDPEKKAKVSITMDKAALTEQLNQTNGQIATIQKLLNLMASWKNDYGRYRKLGEGTTRMDKLYDDNGKAVTTDILDENALEPLEQQLDYAWDEAMKKMEEYNSRRTEKWTKAEMEKNIKRNSPYSYESMKRKELKDKMQQARSERNLVIRQTDQLGIKTEEGLSDFISELEQQSKGINSKLTDIESTKDEKVRMFKEQAEANKANEMDIETMLKDLEEDYRHQVTLGSKEELRNWIELTKNLPKREQARSKNAVTGGKNKYSWKSEDYVGKKATFEKPKNLITSKHTAYDESNPRPETKYIGYTPKEIIKTKEGGTLTKIGYQQQFQKMNNTLNSIKKKVTDKEEKKSYRMQNDVQEILGKDEYYTGLKTRLANMILKFAKRYDDEIIKAYKKDNPGKTPTGPEDFYNYINNYTPMAVNMNLGTESTKGLEYNVSKVEDEYVKQGAEYLFNKYNGAGRNNVTANDKNKITNG